MYHRIISYILVVFLTAVSSANLVKGQSFDSVLYVLDNNLVEDDLDKYNLLCWVIDEIYDAESIIAYSDQAIKLARKLEILPDLPYLRRGDAYMSIGNLPLALECLIQAAEYYETNENVIGIGMVYNSMSETYNRQENHGNAKLYLQKAIDIFEQEKDSVRLSYTLHNLAYFYYSREQYDSALYFYTVTGELFKKLDDSHAIAYAYCLGNSGLVYSRLSDFDKAEECLFQAIDALSKMGEGPAIVEFTIEYANILKEKGEPNKAISYASRALITTDDPVYKREAANLLARIYEDFGEVDSAYYYQSIYIAANESLKNVESVQKMAALRTEYEVGRVQAEVDLLKKLRQRNNIIMMGLGVILILAIGLVASYYNNLKRSRKLSVALEERRVLLVNQSSELKKSNDEIIKAHNELKQLNEITRGQKDEIISSINYAQRIQSVMLPPNTYVSELLHEHFILYKPRDIVSGDFYWVKQVNQYIILVAADCTGHGVPGAFMSMLGISFLNEIVQRREITQANQVLNELRTQIKNALRQHGGRHEAKDGIDMALCVLDMKNNSLQYAGANNPLYLIRDINGKTELKEFKADRMPLGYYQAKDRDFINHNIDLEQGDALYLFSDGFVDQKGGKDNKRYMSKNFKSLLLEIQDQSMQNQKEILEKTLADWMGSNHQTDDILVIGARV